MLTSAFINLKGGVGKTTLVLGLADAIAHLRAEAGHDRRRVLVVDLDPQSNSTQCLLPDLDDETELTTNDVLAADQVGGVVDAIQSTNWDGVDLVPASLELANREMEVGPTAALRLRRALRGIEDYAAGYAAVLIDCGPSAGLLVTNALAAADNAVVVTQPGRAAVRGVAKSLENLDKASELQPDLRLAGIVVNQLDKRVAEHSYRLDELRKTYGDSVWDPVLLERAVVTTAYGAGVPVRSIHETAARSVADDYQAIAVQLLASERQEVA
ncbi:MAG TPA: ParA family protein [Kribbellaceae bacterium]|jgi:cellulose biosynthesis protein BcsQ